MKFSILEWFQKDRVTPKTTERLKGYGGGKNLWTNVNIFFAFLRKTFAFSYKYICVLSQNQLSSDKLF